ncbi:MAG: DNA-binding response regulator [Acidobacteria bacterium]|nr:MAG: DNA-binding response regulator [Acidobacteriota bacterium]
MPKKRVLVVDDNALVRSMVRQLFESNADFEVSGEAENGRDAIQKAENLKPDLIILDLAMPVMTGIEAAPLLRKVLPDARLILFTVSEGPEVDRLARAAGIHAVVPKIRGASKLILKGQALLRSIEQEYLPAKRGTAR